VKTWQFNVLSIYMETCALQLAMLGCLFWPRTGKWPSGSIWCQCRPHCNPDTCLFTTSCRRARYVSLLCCHSKLHRRRCSSLRATGGWTAPAIVVLFIVLVWTTVGSKVLDAQNMTDYEILPSFVQINWYLLFVVRASLEWAALLLFRSRVFMKLWGHVRSVQTRPKISIWEIQVLRAKTRVILCSGIFGQKWPNNCWCHSRPTSIFQICCGIFCSDALLPPVPSSGSSQNAMLPQR